MNKFFTWLNKYVCKALLQYFNNCSDRVVLGILFAGTGGAVPHQRATSVHIHLQVITTAPLSPVLWTLRPDDIPR